MIIVITGTRKGIGRYLAEQYLEEGHTVIGCSRGTSDIFHERYIHYEVDITDEKAVSSFARAIRKEFKTIDVLINNAGAASMNHFMMTPINTAKSLMDLNYIGALTCVKELAGMMRKSQHPRIVNFTTVAVPFNLEGELAYTAAKAAIESMTKIMAKELAHLHITVNAVGPTPVKTDLTAKVPEEKMNKLLDNQAIKRFGEFADVKNVIDFYLSEKSDFVTGQIVYLGGVNR